MTPLKSPNSRSPMLPLPIPLTGQLLPQLSIMVTPMSIGGSIRAALRETDQ